MVSFCAFPVIFIDTVTFKKGTLVKRAGVRTPWTPPGSGPDNMQYNDPRLNKMIQNETGHLHAVTLVSLGLSVCPSYSLFCRRLDVEFAPRHAAAALPGCRLDRFQLIANHRPP